MKHLAGVLAVMTALLLAGCGFTPLYAESGVSPALSRISISTPDTRGGFELRRALEDAFGRNPTEAALWRLETRMEQRRVALGRRVDDTVSRYELILTVHYVLTPVAGSERGTSEPITDAVTATITYAAADQAVAGIAAQRDGEDRVVAEAARLIRLDLARALALPPSQP